MSADDKTRVASPPGGNSVDVGSQLSGIYELDERLASGGMGEVFRGHNIQTGDAVAIKIVLPELARDPMILQLFRKEASILNHLNHEAVVRYHVFTIDPSIQRPYLAMEFVDGESLFDLMRKGPMPTGEVWRLCHRLASGLAAVHQHGAIHRDLSPDNIILPGGRVDRAKIIDFGIARSAKVGGETLIGGKFAGKYNYVSPEQLGLFGGEVSEQSDMYSLGLVLVAALKGKALDMSGSQFEVIEKRRAVPDLSDIDPDFRSVAEAMLQPDPRDRPPSMADIARVARPFADVETTYVPRSGDGAVPTAAPAWSLPPSTGAPKGGPASPPGFVKHQSGVRPQGRPAAQAPEAAAAQKSNMRTYLLAGSVAVVLMVGGGLYAGGIFDAPPASAPADAPVLSKVETPPPAPPEAADQPANETASADQPPQVASPPIVASEPVTESAPPVAAQIPVEEPAPAPQTPAEAAQVPAPAIPAVTPETSPAVTAEPPATASQTPEPAPPAQAAEPDMPPPFEDEKAATAPATQSAEAPAQPPSESSPQPAETVRGSSEEQVAINIPKPEVPAGEAVDQIAQRVNWLREYQGGGDCFYATATSVTDKAIAVEGFGTDVKPFMGMLQAFQAEFKIEPDVGVRLIAQAQCGVPKFLQALGMNDAVRPTLALDRTSIPNGFPISGTLEAVGGLRSSLLLVDHKGMVFNLDDRIRVQSGKGIFSIPIGLGSAEQAAKKALPQLLIAISAPVDIEAAMLTRPTPAVEVLPKILEEVRRKNVGASASAKYFTLGG